MTTEIPITLREPCYGLFDVSRNAYMATEYGNLAIFSVKSMAELWKARAGPNIVVRELRVLETYPEVRA